MSNDLQRKDEGENQDKLRRKPILDKKTWKMLRPAAIVVISLVLCLLIVSGVVSYMLNKFYYPVDKNDATPITIVVPKNYGASAIAKLLYEACGEGNEGLISSKAVFKVYVDFTGKSAKLRAGTYVLSKNMDIGQMVDTICAGNPPKPTVRFTIPEGMDVEGVAQKLVDLGIIKNKDTFLSLCKSGDSFTNFAFIGAIEKNPAQARDYVLEGYLFPDTYEVYVDSSEKTIINKMLLRFFEVFTDEYAARAQEFDMSMDNVISLAALIEKEAKTADFAKVSAVFHNRLAKDMNLGSDAPLRYIFKTNTLEFTGGQMSDTSRYNTHVYKGLPLGPITNPGQAAIEAALYPDEDYIKNGYLYFCLKDGKTGELVFAKTIEEHNANVQKYKPNW
ncbi:MAG: endolytic transglycosylase MltG [Clostridia bacterium]